MLETIKPDNYNQLLDLTTTMVAPTNAAVRNITCDNQQQQVTNTFIGKVLGKLLNYYHFIKGPNTKIWERVLANYLVLLSQLVVSIMPKGKNTIFHPPMSYPKRTKCDIRITRSINTIVFKKYTDLESHQRDTSYIIMEMHHHTLPL